MAEILENPYMYMFYLEPDIEHEIPLRINQAISLYTRLGAISSNQQWKIKGSIKYLNIVCGIRLFNIVGNAFNLYQDVILAAPENGESEFEFIVKSDSDNIFTPNDYAINFINSSEGSSGENLSSFELVNIKIYKENI